MKRIIAVCLLAAMLAALCSLCVFADDPGQGTQPEPGGSMRASTVCLCAAQTSESAAANQSVTLPRTRPEAVGCAHLRTPSPMGAERFTAVRDEREQTLTLLCRRLTADPEPGG